MDGVFKLVLEQGAFPIDSMPDELRGQDVKFSFNSPLSEMADQGDTEAYLNVVNQILAPLAQLMPEQLQNADMTTATRDAMRAAGWKAKWFNPEEAVEEAKQQQQQAQQAQEQMMSAQMLGQAAEQGGKGLAAINKAGEDIEG
jgi:hypothetical protein